MTPKYCLEEMAAGRCPAKTDFLYRNDDELTPAEVIFECCMRDSLRKAKIAELLNLNLPGVDILMFGG
jgi:hypothetical protein